MTNSADLDHLASSEDSEDLHLHCLQRQGISGFSRTRVQIHVLMLTQVLDSIYTGLVTKVQVLYVSGERMCTILVNRLED